MTARGERIRVVVADGRLPFCCEAEVYDALEIDPTLITTLTVSVAVAGLITCYGCGFGLTDVVGGERVGRTV